MNNQANNAYKFTGQQNFPHSSGSDPQRPLIDVARSYCKTLNPSTSRENIFSSGKKSETKENKSTPASGMAYSAFSTQGSPYTWKAQSNNSSKTPTPVKQCSTPTPRNPYSWKAPSKSPATLTESRENTPTANIADPSFPRPPRLPLPKSFPKLEPLSISITKDSDVRTVIEKPQSQSSPSPSLMQQSPLQPFSPSGNCHGCTCMRNPKVILCQSCGLIQKGRMSMACSLHPRQVFLMDLNCCSGCKSTSLKEVCDAKK